MDNHVIVTTHEELSSLVKNSVKSAMREEIDNITKTPSIMREKDAAEYLQLSPQTLRQYRSNGIGPAYSKAGATVIYAKKDLDIFLENTKIRTS